MNARYDTTSSTLYPDIRYTEDIAKAPTHNALLLAREAKRLYFQLYNAGEGISVSDTRIYIILLS